jgi:hypothetical protein
VARGLSGQGSAERDERMSAIVRTGKGIGLSE